MLVIKRKYLDAALLFAAKDDVRYYLNAVWIGKGPNGDTLLTATDGHHAAIINPREPYPADMPAAGFVLRREQVAAALKMTRKGDVVGLAPGQVGTITGAGIDAEYPDVLRISPRDLSGDVAQFNPALLANFAKARKLLLGKGDNAVVVGHNGDRAARVSIGDPDSIGIVMPLRKSTVPSLGELPEWLAPVATDKAA